MKTYCIAKNTHRGFNWIRLTTAKSFSVEVVFHKAAYNLNNENQLDWNKLFGLSGNWHHHDDSIRLGWRYNNETNKIEFCVYSYKDGMRVVKDKTMLGFDLFPSIEVGETINFVFNYGSKKGEGLYLVRGYTKRTGGSCFFPFVFKLPIHYLLYPYFGGNEKAPTDIVLDMSYELF